MMACQYSLKYLATTPAHVSAAATVSHFETGTPSFRSKSQMAYSQLPLTIQECQRDVSPVEPYGSPTVVNVGVSTQVSLPGQEARRKIIPKAWILETMRIVSEGIP
jgi:hypothetical protein